MTVVYENIAFVSAGSAFLCGILTIGYGIKESAHGNLYNKGNRTLSSTRAFWFYLSLEYCCFWFFFYFCTFLHCFLSYEFFSSLIHDHFWSQLNNLLLPSMWSFYANHSNRKRNGFNIRNDVHEFIWLSHSIVFELLCSWESVRNHHVFSWILVCNRIIWNKQYFFFRHKMQINVNPQRKRFELMFRIFQLQFTEHWVI